LYAADAPYWGAVLEGLGALADLVAGVPRRSPRRSEDVIVPGRPGPVRPRVPGRPHDGWLSRPHSPPDRKPYAGRRSGCRPVTQTGPDSPPLQHTDRTGVASAAPATARPLGPAKQRRNARCMPAVQLDAGLSSNFAHSTVCT